ncbi:MULTISPECIES: hypothetical protein [Rhizobium]|uniref:Transposase n=1 Tax=Rhizobium aouanii TaxID=3118145 RepID=A0ABU8CIP5_9HYPH|nr:hypothetical protein [Rhizobium acaciae]MCW1750272.1 hypothetical protein [Rhizobium acaciae]
MRSKIDVGDSVKKVAPSRHYDLGALKLMAGIVGHSFSAPLAERAGFAAPYGQAEARPPRLCDSGMVLQVTGCSGITMWRKRQTQGLITFRCFSNLTDEHHIKIGYSTVERVPIALIRKSIFRRPGRRLRGLHHHSLADATLQGQMASNRSTNVSDVPTPIVKESLNSRIEHLLSSI